jgi:hypothetical protein
MKYRCSEGICSINNKVLYCAKMNRKTGVFEAPKQTVPDWYCPYIQKYVLWIEYDLEYIMKEAIRKHEESNNPKVKI